MRGKGFEGYQESRRSGITPAYAGKRPKSFTDDRRCGDHPRVCGEKKRLSTCAQQAEGSPPRMRGKAARAVDGKSPPGITPAYAGKSYTRTCYAYNVWDHPRVCGEKRHTTKPEHSKIGSPPRMRGKDRSAARASSGNGITPAYAGKSCHPHLKKALPGDHPRVCGEKYDTYHPHMHLLGSPPRMRGKALHMSRHGRR